MKTTENNKLIAEFMELEASPKYNPKEYYIKEYNSGEWYLPEEMQYHTSWDWLMPVVDKIEQVHEGVPKQLINLSLFSTRQEIYQAVVEFIKEFNKN